MASENGWEPAWVGQDRLVWLKVPGTKVSLQLNNSESSKVMLAFAADYNSYVEPLRDPDSACYTPTNSVSTSNHLNGTAMDLNWDSHPFHVKNTFNPEQQKTIRDLLNFYEGTMYWGGDWNDPIDEMHWQMGYNSFNNPKTNDFIQRKIRADGFSTFRRGPAVPTPVLASVVVPASTEGEKVLNYNHDIVPQETGYWCGPASTQVILSARGINVPERDLANLIGTTVNGTDFIGQIETRALDKYLPEANYTTVVLPHDPPSQQETEDFWDRLTSAIDAGYGVSMNWVSPPNNAPRGIKGSQSPNGYGSSTIFHYLAAMGYSNNPERAVWVADSGFKPWGYWITLQQCMTLMPPKGYVYPATFHKAPAPVAPPVVTPPPAVVVPPVIAPQPPVAQTGISNPITVYRILQVAVADKSLDIMPNIKKALSRVSPSDLKNAMTLIEQADPDLIRAFINCQGAKK